MIYYSGVAHYFETILDVFKYNSAGKEKFTVVLVARLSGKPHIGTLVNFLTGFMLAKEFQKTYKKETNVVIELIDNISDKEITNLIQKDMDLYYYKTLVGSHETLNSNYNAFIRLIKRIEYLTNIASTVFTYEQIQAQPEIRQSILKVIQKNDFFAELFDPKGKKLHIRTACPHCGLIEKTCNHTRIKSINSESVEIINMCPIHGEFSTIFDIENKTYVDINVPMRQFCRGLSLVNCDKKNNGLSVQVLGNDWSGIWPLRMFCEGMLEVHGHKLPSFLFSPLILDKNGKISKSKINRTEPQDAFLNVNLLTDEQLKNIWNEIALWFKNSEKFFTNYELNYLKGVINTNEEIRV